jgi:predicted small lipoprotein YifL
VKPGSSTISRRRALLVCALPLALSALLSGCGQKGALYLPQKKKSKVPPDAGNPAASEAEQAPAAPPQAPSSPSNPPQMPPAAAPDAPSTPR